MAMLLIPLCLVAGIALSASRRIPANASATLNAFVIYLSLPALTISALQGIKLEGALLYPAAMGWFLFFAALLFFVAIGPLIGADRTRVGALLLTCGFGNTSFVGFPLLEAFYGHEALRTGVVIDQLGCFLPLATVGIVAGSHFGAGRLAPTALLRRIVVFPPFLALVVGLAVSQSPLPPALLDLLDRLGGTLIPLALVSVGCQLRFDAATMRRERLSLAAGLFFKLVAGPAVIAFLYLVVFGVHGRDIEITLVEAAMAPMITGAVLAAELGLDAALANLLVAFGIPLSLLTVPLWSRLLSLWAA